MELETLRHSASHILAQAVKRLYSGVRLGIGPPIKDGFYYDFDSSHPFNPEDLKRIEEEMKKIVKENYKFEKLEVSKEEAEKLFKDKGETYKLELLREIPDKNVTLYRDGEFIDLCRGPHVESTGKVKYFKLLSVWWKEMHGKENGILSSYNLQTL